MHIQRNTRKYKGKVYRCTLLRQSYYEGGKSRQRTIANLTHMSDALIRTIELAIKPNELTFTLNDLNFETAVDYGQVATFDHLLHETGLDTILYSKAIPERLLVEAMIIARIGHPSSKLENTRWLSKSALAFQEVHDLDYERLKVDKLYQALDWLERRKERIEARLVQLHGKGRQLFLYDTTSTYFEGEAAEGAAYGYSRDERPANKQIVIATR